MAGESVQIEGLQKLQRELKKVSTELPKEMKAIAKAGAEIVAAEARVKVPVQSGRLQKKIKAAATLKGGQVRVTGLPYAAVIHFGWPRHHIKPQPFIYEALDSRRDEVIANFDKGLHALMEANFTPGTT